MSKFYVIGKASPELLKKMHADPTADRGAVMKSMCDSLGVKAISYEWLRGRFDVLFCVEGLSLIHIRRCRRYAVCRSRWSPYH